MSCDCLGFPQLLATIFFPQAFHLSVGVGFVQVFIFVEYHEKLSLFPRYCTFPPSFLSTATVYIFIFLLVGPFPLFLFLNYLKYWLEAVEPCDSYFKILIFLRGSVFVDMPF